MSDFNTEELLEHYRKLVGEDLHKHPKLVQKTVPDVLLRFVRKMKIEHGQYKYPTYVIYYLFCKNITRGSAIFSRRSFFSYFSKLFEQVRTGKQRYYKLNLFIEITDELLNLAHKFNGLKHAKKFPKVVETNPNQISKSTEKV